LLHSAGGGVPCRLPYPRLWTGASCASTRPKRDLRVKAAPIRNNFHLIRLFAAINVMALHSWDHFGFVVRPVRILLEAVPGVPIFFVVSGFLIVRSWERTPDGPTFFRNRFLRIFPALWLCFGISLATVWASGFVVDATPIQLMAWVVAQLSIFQNVTPGFMNGYGTGILNGALWTIPLELQFYLLTPLLFRWLPRWTIFPMIAAFAAINQLPSFDIPVGPAVFSSNGLFFGYVYMYLIGAATYLYFDRIRPLLAGRFWQWLAVYVAACLIGAALGWQVGTNDPMPLLMVPLALLVLAAAYSAPGLSARQLGDNDLSYGIYLYHMPVINFLVQMQTGSPIVAMVVTIGLAALSWALVERTALRLKAGVIRTA
jgi:peptidoglycan/LPS O-acetylase OafA/YrhL